MYGCPRETSVNSVRFNMFKKMVGDEETLTNKSKVDFARIPPCFISLVPHIQRVNHRVAHYKRASQPNFTGPEPHEQGQGWEKTGKGLLEPVWSLGPIFPPTMIDMVAMNYVEDIDTANIAEDDDEYDTMDIDIDVLDEDDDV